jgi:hypothetical protein
MNEPTPTLDPLERHRCAVCGEHAAYGFGPPGVPIAADRSVVLRQPSGGGRAGLSGGISAKR